MNQKDSPQFETHRPEPGESPRYRDPVRWFKVVSTGNGPNSDVMLCHLCRGDGSGAGSNNFSVKIAKGQTHAAGDVIMAVKPASGAGTVYNSEPVYLAELSGGFTPSWGTLTALWTPGTNQVVLTPCKGPLDNTPTGATNVTCYIQFPLAKPALCLGAAAGDVLAYATYSGINKLFDPPLLPVPTAQYQVISNNSSDATAPNYIPDYPREHS